MKPGLTIRKALPSDLDAIVDVWLRSVRATHDFLPQEHIDHLLPLVREKSIPNLEVWVLCDADSTIAGFMGLSGVSVEALFIAPEWFGKSGGTLLLDHARALKGPLAVDVNEQNAAAVVFYLTRGFRVVGRSPLDGQGNPYPLLHMREGGG